MEEDAPAYSNQQDENAQHGRIMKMAKSSAGPGVHIANVHIENIHINEVHIASTARPGQALQNAPYRGSAALEPLLPRDDAQEIDEDAYQFSFQKLLAFAGTYPRVLHCSVIRASCGFTAFDL